MNAFYLVTSLWIAVGIAVLPVTLAVTPPFGRHARERFGPRLDNRWGWLIMESPALFGFTLVFLWTVSHDRPTAWLLWGLWMIHYVNRALIYPFRTRTQGKKIPLAVVTSGFGFQLVNAYLNGMALGAFGAQYTLAWLRQPTFWIGALLFFGGWFANIWSDEILLRLRQPGESGYRIPRGGLFHWVSCPNFLGEMLEWLGWAIMCWNIAALSFAVWTFANLLPRALAHHRWYQRQFHDYPAHRKAVFPGLL